MICIASNKCPRQYETMQPPNGFKDKKTKFISVTSCKGVQPSGSLVDNVGGLATTVVAMFFITKQFLLEKTLDRPQHEKTK